MRTLHPFERTVAELTVSSRWESAPEHVHTRGPTKTHVRTYTCVCDCTYFCARLQSSRVSLHKCVYAQVKVCKTHPHTQHTFAQTHIRKNTHTHMQTFAHTHTHNRMLMHRHTRPTYTQARTHTNKNSSLRHTPTNTYLMVGKNQATEWRNESRWCTYPRCPPQIWHRSVYVCSRAHTRAWPDAHKSTFACSLNYAHRHPNAHIRTQLHIHTKFCMIIHIWHIYANTHAYTRTYDAHTHAHTRTQADAHRYAYTRRHRHRHMCSHTYAHTYAHTHMHSHIDSHTHTRTHTHTLTHSHTRTHTHTNTNTHTQIGRASCRERV